MRAAHTCDEEEELRDSLRLCLNMFAAARKDIGVSSDGKVKLSSQWFRQKVHIMNSL